MWTRKRRKSWRMRTDKEIKDVLHREDFVNFIKTLRLRVDFRVENMQNQRIAKQFLTSAVEGTREEDNLQDGERRFKET
jgi:hypothetical protein